MIQIAQWVVGVASRLAAAFVVLVALDERFLLAVPLLGFAQLAAAYGVAPLLIRRHVAWQTAEGALRGDLMRIRDCAEEIAFYGGEAAEGRTVLARTGEAAARHFRQERAGALVSLGVDGAFTLAWTLLPYLLLGERVAAGAMSYGALAQAAAVTVMMRDVVQTLALILSSLGTLATRVVRLAPLQERFDALGREPDDRPRIAAARYGDALRIEALSLSTPDGARQLVRDLDVALQAGDSLVVVGETGIGKSSLLRAVAGLWTRGGGRVVLPASGAILFLPQRPYLTRETLRAQLLYPGSADPGDAALLAILDAVRLPQLGALGLAAVRDWPQVLSGGEQQRLAFARVLVARPVLVFLDEATSARDAPTERHLYDLLGRSGATYVIVAHRPALVAHHARVLTLLAGGRWTLETVAPRMILADRAGAAT